MRWMYIVMFVLAIVTLGLALVGAASAQGGKPPVETITVQPLAPTGGAGPDAPLGTTFSYQGLLKINGVPYTGNCDLQFTLWNGHPDSGGISLATVSAVPAQTSVSNGLFTTYVDFGAQFQGDYREIEPQVRCPSGDGAYQSLGVQTIYPVPYALGLRSGATISGMDFTGLKVVSRAEDGTGITGENDNGTNAWGVFGFSSSGAGVVASGGDNSSTPSTALRIYGGKLAVGGSVKPAFVFTVSGVSAGCGAMSNPLLNGDPDAMIFVTPRQVDDGPVAVGYNFANQMWYLCGSPLIDGAQYNVLVINQQ